MPERPTEFAAVWKTLAFTDTLDAPALRRATLRAPTALASAPTAIDPGASATKGALPQVSLSFAPGLADDARDATAGMAPGPSDFEVRQLLGGGGMGRVHLARQRSLERDVAVKTLHEGGLEGPAAAALLSEAVIAGALEHPNILPVHLLGRDARGGPVLVMKRIEGVSWSDVLADPKHPVYASSPLFASDALAGHLEVLVQVCSALHFAHSRGVVHRDLKPENVMLGPWGEVYLVDWGVAYKTDAPTPADGRVPVVGTPAYMAPEMLEGRVPDARTDVYLLGATLHEVLTGRGRHEGATLEEMLRAAFESKPFGYDPSVPAELAALCNRATSRDPAERPASAQAFQRALREYLAHRGSIALAQTTHARLDELRAHLARPAGEADASALARLATECRFGFAQALRDWEGNASARDGLQRTLELLAEHELARENAAGARSLLAELPSPRPALEEQARALEATLATRATKAAEAARLEQEMDVRVGARQRLALVGALGLTGVGITAYALSTGVAQGGRGARLELLLRFWLGVCAVALAGAAAGRKALLQNAMNRRTGATLAIALGAVLVNRVAGVRFATPVAAQLVGDMLLLAATLGMMSVTLLRRAASAALLFVAASVLVLARPGWVTLAFSGSTIASMALLAWAWRSEERAADKRP